MLKSIAIQKPLTEKPWITDEASKINKALMTKVNKPSVRILIGSVKITRIGFIMTLIRPRNKATHNAAQKPARATPGKR